MVSTENIKALRDKTGVSVMACKRALEEADGDEAKALIILKKRSGEVAAKKADRSLGAGTVASYVHATGAVGAMVLLSTETDFVAKNEDFKSLARDIAMQVTATNPEFLRVEDITPEASATARAVFENEVREQAGDKPEEMKEKILQGKIDAYFRERILLEQPFIKAPEKTIRHLIDEATQRFGERIDITTFSRVSL